jgi:glucose/arabinose dehydrogenase
MKGLLKTAAMTLLLYPLLIACAVPVVMQTTDPCSVTIPVAGKPTVELEPVVSGLTNPVYVTDAGDGSGRLFVVEQSGIIRIIQNGVLLSTPFLDIRERVESGGEKGLLSVAFHPNYKSNGRFFVDYTTRQSKQLKTIIAEFQVSAADPNLADLTSERVLLQIDQPFDNHNGGLVLFGPDGYLYIGMGDGGSGGDPFGNGQNLNAFLGKLLRIDVDGARPYAIPPDNPFAGVSGTRPEIWAYGLRNPWRFSFDRCTGRLFVADVGQDRYEEVDVIEKGGNYGWNIMEGAHCFKPTFGCDMTGLKLPIIEYDHSLGCAITGGYVYRGTRYPDLIGRYFFGDYCSGRIWALSENSSGGWVMTELLHTQLNISSFGEDENGEFYVLDYNGALYHIKGQS